MKTSRIALLAGGAMLALSAVVLPVQAQPGPGPGQPPGAQAQQPAPQAQLPARAMPGFALGEAFARADANNDGRVTLEEIRPFAEAWFRARDVNTDGALSREEVMPRRHARAGHHHHRGGPSYGMGPGMGRGAPPAPQSN